MAIYKTPDLMRCLQAESPSYLAVSQSNGSADGLVVLAAGREHQDVLALQGLGDLF